LNKRFGSVPPALQERISTATTEQIEAWFDLAIDASDLDHVKYILTAYKNLEADFLQNAHEISTIDPNFLRFLFF
jgi:hypothetical protein